MATDNVEPRVPSGRDVWRVVRLRAFVFLVLISLLLLVRLAAGFIPEALRLAVTAGLIFVVVACVFAYAIKDVKAKRSSVDRKGLYDRMTDDAMERRRANK